MKRIILTLVMLISSVSLTFSQSETKNNNYPYSVGPFITMKGGVNAASVPQGIQNGFAINSMPDIGVTGYVPLTNTFPLGIAIDIAYSTYCYDNKLTGNNTLKWTSNAGYFTFGPNLYIGGFNIGFNFGIPLAMSLDKYKGQTWDVKSEQLASFLEFRLGGLIPVYSDNFGRLNILVQAGYFLTPQFKSDMIPSFYDDLNFHPASASLGISYLFNLIKK